MGFFSKLFGGGEKKPDQKEMQSSNPTADLEAIKAKNQSEAGASEAGVAPSGDKYGQNPAEKTATPTAEAPEVSPAPEQSTTTPNQAAGSPEQSDDQKAA